MNQSKHLQTICRPALNRSLTDTFHWRCGGGWYERCRCARSGGTGSSRRANFDWQNELRVGDGLHRPPAIRDVFNGGRIEFLNNNNMLRMAEAVVNFGMRLSCPLAVHALTLKLQHTGSEEVLRPVLSHKLNLKLPAKQSIPVKTLVVNVEVKQLDVQPKAQILPVWGKAGGQPPTRMNVYPIQSLYNENPGASIYVS